MTESLSSDIDALETVEPELCRVSVIGANTQVDLGLPATLPIASFIGEVVSLIESRNPDLTESDEDDPLEAQHWTLARLGRDAIDVSRSLADADVHDGELLILRSVTAAESPALFDDVIDAISRLTTVEFRSWSAASAQWTGLVTAVVATVAAVALFALSKRDNMGIAAGCVGIVAGIGVLVAAVLAARMYKAELTATVLSLCGLLSLFGGLVVVLPGGLGSPHLLLACSVTLLFAVASYRTMVVGTTMHTAVIVVTAFGLVAAAIRMGAEANVSQLGAGIAVVAMIGVSLAPRLAFVMARLPVPPVPTAGGAIDPADHEQRPTIEGIGAIGATALPSAVGLERRARVANQYQSGMLLACTGLIGFGAFLAANPLRSTAWQGLALAGVLSAVLCLRGRSFADLTQAATLIVGGCLTAVAVAIGVGVGDPSRALPAAVVVLVVAVLAVIFGVVAPHTETSPLTIRAGEILEYVLIVCIIPLALWVLDLYSLARDM